jgi:lipoyl(octanoyl) transferase
MTPDAPAVDRRGEVRPLNVQRLGIVSYADALELQTRLVGERRANEISDQLLLLQHPPVITLGVKSRNDRSHILETPEKLAARGIDVVETGRGGDVTYHGPGQLVGYPIIDLNPDRRDVHQYVRDLEEVLIRTVAEFGIAATRQPELTGVWVGDGKVAAIGVRIARWVTSHGFALNVTTDLEHFGLIVPCGITDKTVTSIEKLTGRAASMTEVESIVTNAFAAVFDRQITG